MAGLGDLIQQKAKQIGSDGARMAKVRDWIGSGYVGKVICFSAPKASYHIVITPDKVSARDGDYPSCEVSYRGSEEALAAVLEGKSGAHGAAKSGRLQVWGSLNEAMRFEALL